MLKVARLLMQKSICCDWIANYLIITISKPIRKLIGAANPLVLLLRSTGSIKEILIYTINKDHDILFAKSSVVFERYTSSSSGLTVSKMAIFAFFKYSMISTSNLVSLFGFLFYLICLRILFKSHNVFVMNLVSSLYFVSPILSLPARSIIIKRPIF